MATAPQAQMPWLDRWVRIPFRTESLAFLSLFIMMLVWIGAYVYWHKDQSVPDTLIDAAIDPSPVGYLEVEYDDAFLESVFPMDTVNSLKMEISSELEQARAPLLIERKRVLREAGVFACTTLNTDFLPATLAALGATGELNGVPCKAGVAMPAPSQDIYIYADVTAIIHWYKSICPDCDWKKLAAAQNTAFTTAAGKDGKDPLEGRIAPEKRALYYFILKDLMSLSAREKAVYKDADDRVNDMFDGLQFSFLHLRGTGWIMELTFWSIMGVLGNTLAGLIEAWRKKDVSQGINTYDPEHFMLVIPKMVLAPVMSLIVVAMVFNGWLEVKLNLSNQPVFLVLAFALGYASEKVNHILRRSINKLMGKLEFSDENFQKATTATRLLSQAWKDTTDTPKDPQTWQEAKTEAVRQAMAKAGPAVTAQVAAKST